MTWAAPGVKCVCVHEGEWRVVEDGFGSSATHPAYGEICTIAEVKVRLSGRVALLIEGYQPSEYQTRWFRPLVTRTQDQDLEHFAPLLTDTSVPA